MSANARNSLNLCGRDTSKKKSDCIKAASQTLQVAGLGEAEASMQVDRSVATASVSNLFEKTGCAASTGDAKIVGRRDAEKRWRYTDD